MTVLSLVCATCGQRFVGVRVTTQPACSAACLSALYLRRMAERRERVEHPRDELAPHFLHPQRAPNRIELALNETRAAVEQLLAEGRRLHIEHQETST